MDQQALEKRIEERIAEIMLYEAQAERLIADLTQKRNAINAQLDQELARVHAAQSARSESERWLAELREDDAEAEAEVEP